MKSLPIIAIIIAGVVIINELSWLEKSSLAWVIIALSAAIILIAIYVLDNKE